ncbi:DUF1592 domain-containing protein [Rubripirellula amarantea]|nr:DUF1592 domain-containing protein [Rubripirellula amarantea]
MLCIIAAVTSFALCQTIALADDDETMAIGAKIYQEKCVMCHGGEGQGNQDYYPDPLTGDNTVGELAELISETMPEEDPDECVAEDAVAVASYIHHEFYSEAAQIRRRPPRAVLARLTGNQLRQSLADLYARFGDAGWRDDKQGLSGRYYNNSHWDDKKLSIERVDPTIDFDFGLKGPSPEDSEGAKKIDPEEYFIYWSGSLRVPESGRYELIVKSSCSFTLDFGSRDRELIDNHVQSAGKEEFRRSLFLTGGRDYPIELQLRQRKRKTEQPPAYISFSWVRPGGVEEIVPAKYLAPSNQPPVFPLQAKLPPDDRSYGYERGTAINRSWDESTTAAAVEFADVAIAELYPQYKRRHKKDPNENRQVLRKFLKEIVSTAFRRPLDSEMEKHFVDRFVDEIKDDAEAIRIVCLYTIKSPRFLYPLLDKDRPDSYRIGSRLALTLFDSLPADPLLRKEMEKDQLKNPKKVTEVAWRMVDDTRCRSKTRQFLYEWFDLAQIDEITKDKETYPNFDAALVADLRESFDAMLEEVVYSESSDFRLLLQSDWSFTTERLASFYGDAWKPADGQSGRLMRSVHDPIRHVGVLSHPLLMSELAYHRTSSPVHRGVFMTRHVLGRVLRPPNAAFSPLNPDLHPGLTTRERVALQTGEVSCQVCHSKINAVGFAFENFDAAGRYREMENDKPIDASGSYITRTGETATFDGVRELGDYLAGSPDCHRSFVEAAFEHFVKQPIAAFGPNLSDELTQSFQNSGFNIRQLIVSIAEIVANQSVAPEPTPS